MCISFQFQKHLSLGRGGMILLDSQFAKQELKRMSHKIDEDDSISVSDQIAWFMNSS